MRRANRSTTNPRSNRGGPGRGAARANAPGRAAEDEAVVLGAIVKNCVAAGLEGYLDGPDVSGDGEEYTLDASCLDSRTPTPPLLPEEGREGEEAEADSVRVAQTTAEPSPLPSPSGNKAEAREFSSALARSSAEDLVKGWGQAVEPFAPDHDPNAAADQNAATTSPSPRLVQKQSALVAAYGAPPQVAKGPKRGRGRQVRLRPVGAEAEDVPEASPLPPPDHPTPSYPSWRPASTPRPPQGPRPPGAPRRPPGDSNSGGFSGTSVTGAARAAQDSGAGVAELPELRSPGRQQRRSPLDVYRGQPFPSARGSVPSAASKGRRRSKELAGIEPDLDLDEAGLPRLANDEDLQSWRNLVAESALRFARVCDVPRSMLRNCGAISLG